MLTGAGLRLVAFLVLIVEVARFGGFSRPLAGSSEDSCSIERAALPIYRCGIGTAMAQVHGDDGEKISAGSATAAWHHEFLIGSV